MDEQHRPGGPTTRGRAGGSVHPDQLDLGFNEPGASPQAQRHRQIRLMVLLSILGALTIYALASRTDILHAHETEAGEEVGASPPALVARGGCASGPAVIDVSPWRLAELRAGLLSMIAPLDGRRYAEGTVTGENAWSDDTPQPVESQPAAGPFAGGYEMRLWVHGEDDIAADVFVFAGPRQAQDYLRRATDERCRNAGATSPARWPPEARNLTWINPDAAREADVYLARGRRVYRVVDVRSRYLGKPPRVERRIALAIVDDLACLLPAADCSFAEHRPASHLRRVDDL
jgi:hypothetical protein